MSNLSAEQLFERVVLNSLTTNKEYFSKAFSILKDEYFSNERQEVFKLLSNHYKEFKTPPNIQDVVIQIKNLQNQDRKASIVKEIQEISKTLEPNSLESLCEETLSFVKDSLYLKALEIGSEGLMLKSDELKKKAEKILEERAKISISTDLGIEFSDLDIIDYYTLQLTGLLTQHNCLNERLGPGFLKKTLSLIAAASGVGKSLMMTDLISGFVKAGKNVLLVSLEMSSPEVMKRVHSNTLDFPMIDFLPHNFSKERFIQRIQEGKRKGFGTFYAKEFPALTFSSLQLENLLETYRNEKNIEFDIVFVDYLGIMKSDLLSPSVGLYSYIKSIAEELRAVAVRNDVAIISASQLNRSGNNTLDADNSAISDSFGTLMTADFLLFLLQTEDMKANGDIVCKITKNRFSGRTETFPMKVDYTYMRFYDPEIPTNLGERDEFVKEFEANKEQCEKELKEIQLNDIELAKIKDEQMKKEQEIQSLNDVFESLL